MNRTRSLFFCMLAVYCINASAQYGPNTNWHFGNGLSLNFQNVPLILGDSEIQTPSLTEPSTLSEANGNLILYSEGDQVYNSIGDIVVNSAFSNSAAESILAPIPGQVDRYYIFRSDASFGVDYSIVDFSLSTTGEIAATEKETLIQPFQSQLLIASHPNNIDYWLIVLNNNGGSGSSINIKTYLVSALGINLTSEFEENFSFATWYPTLDDARISPNCDRIATSHKGHYITLFDFDNEIGEVVDFFAQSVSLPDGFFQSDLNFIEFSASGDFLYVLQDHYFVTRFDAMASNANFQLSGELVLWNDTMDWSHLKRGPDAKIYLINQQTEKIDYFENIDADLIADINFVEGEIDLTNNAVFFPNTLSNCLSLQFVNALDICEGWTASFNAVGYDLSDSLFWDVEIPESNDTLFYGANGELDELEQGIYPIVFNYLIDTIWYSVLDTIEVFEQPFVDFGEDLTLCAGESVLLETGSKEFQYFWIDGSNDPALFVDSPGLYAVMIGNGPCTASDEIQIDYIYEPEVNLADTVLCFEDSFVVLNAFDNNADQYMWSTGSISDSIVVTDAGFYEVDISNSCFIVNASATVDYVLIPDLVDDEYQVCGSDILNVNSNYTFGSIDWSNGNSGSIGTINGEGDFFVNVNDRGCFRSDFFEVNRIDYLNLNQIIFPNVITPNEDIYNLEFRPFDPSFPQENPCDMSTFKAQVNVFNRWGEQLGESNCEWDANDISDGTYFYVADLESNCLDFEQKQRRKGTFTIIR